MVYIHGRPGIGLRVLLSLTSTYIIDHVVDTEIELRSEIHC